MFFFLTLFLFLIAGVSINLAFYHLLKDEKVKIRKNRYGQLKDLIRKTVNEEKLKPDLKKSDFRISMVSYQLIRYLLIVFGFIYFFFFQKLLMHEKLNTVTIAFFILLVFASAPVSKIGRWQSPFRWFLQKVTESRQERTVNEMYQGLIQLKNLITVHRDHPPGTLYILEQLQGFAKFNKGLYGDMIQLWQIGKEEEACEILTQGLGPKEGPHITSIFLKMNQINPIELKKNIKLILEMIKRERETKKIRNNQLKGYFIYAIVLVAIMSIFKNFMTLTFLIQSFHSLL